LPYLHRIYGVIHFDSGCTVILGKRKFILAPKRHLRRNLFLFFSDYVLFGTAFGLIGLNTVIPDFVSRLTDAKNIVGLVPSLYLFAWLIPQLFMAQIVSRSGRGPKSYMWMAIPFRVVLALVALAIGLIGPSNPTLMLIIFVVGYLFFALGDGLITLVWADMLGSTIPDKWRGTLFSGGQVLLAFTALITREVVRSLLGPTGPTFPQNFAQIFGIASALFIVGGFALASLVEENQTVSEPGPTMREYLPYLGNVLSTDRDFQKFTLTRTLLDLTLMSAPFYVLFGSEIIARAQGVRVDQISGEIVGNSILISTAGSAIGGLFMGWFSHRSGSKMVIMLAGIGSCLHPALALSTFAIGQIGVYGALFVLGFVSASTVPGYFDWIITHAPPDRRPIYVGLTNTISAVSHLAPFFGGIILSLSSYTVLFVAALVMAVLGVISVIFLTEPRSRKSIVYSLADERQTVS
jgi:MFS family permease